MMFLSCLLDFYYKESLIKTDDIFQRIGVFKNIHNIMYLYFLFQPDALVKVIFIYYLSLEAIK
jgi:hypothetical protein